MRPKILAIATLFPTLILTTLPAQAENLEHTRQLLSTRQCAGCDLSNAGLVFANLAGANLVQANLMQANLSQANLQGADLRGANLVGVSLNGANLAGARLDGANLSGADLRNAYLVGITYEGVVTNGTYLEGAIGLPTQVGSVEDFYRWAIEDERKKDYVNAIKNFSRVIERKPEFAPAFIGRSAARLQGGDTPGAIADARQAEKLFKAKGDAKNAEIANKIAMALEKPPEERPKKGGFGKFLVGLLGSALQLFLTRFPIPFL